MTCLHRAAKPLSLAAELATTTTAVALQDTLDSEFPVLLINFLSSDQELALIRFDAQLHQQSSNAELQPSC